MLNQFFIKDTPQKTETPIQRDMFPLARLPDICGGQGYLPTQPSVAELSMKYYGADASSLSLSSLGLLQELLKLGPVFEAASEQKSLFTKEEAPKPSASFVAFTK